MGHESTVHVFALMYTVDVNDTIQYIDVIQHRQKNVGNKNARLWEIFSFVANALTFEDSQTNTGRFVTLPDKLSREKEIYAFETFLHANLDKKASSLRPRRSTRKPEEVEGPTKNFFTVSYGCARAVGQ